MAFRCYTVSVVLINRSETMSREYTNKLLEMVEDGLLDRDTVIMACVKYMSESDVQDMMECNEFILEEDEDEDEDDGQPDEMQEWADFDADC
jgi:hypothetical protein